jgi:hypothetical protein
MEKYTMPATVTIAAAQAVNPDWKPGWETTRHGLDTRIASPRFGTVETAVVVNDKGEPQFDRPFYQEAPCGQFPVWGYGADGKVRFGLIVQARPHADAPGPENFGKPNEPVFFLTCSMGFRDQIRGKLETELVTARREVTEEIGKAVILSEWKHSIGINPSPSFTSTWVDICALQVDLSTVIPAKHDPAEMIAGRYWLSVAEYLKAVAVGFFTTPEGKVAYPAFGSSNCAMFAFLCAHPRIMAEGCMS